MVKKIAIAVWIITAFFFGILLVNYIAVKAQKGENGEAEAEPEQPSEEASELEATVVSEDTEAAPAPVPDAGLATSET